MAWDFFGLYKLGVQSVQDLHVANVYKDPEFIKDIEQIYPKGTVITTSPFIVHTSNKGDVVEDGRTIELPDHSSFLKTVHLLNMNDKKKALDAFNDIDDNAFNIIAKRYAIRPRDVVVYLIGTSQVYGVESTTKNPFELKWAEDDYTARFSIDITKEDFMQIWKVVSSHKKQKYDGKIPKAKLPENDRLLYAIFKARQQKLPFSKIYTLYDNKVLPYYENGAIGLGSEDKLEQYYRKYRPQLIET